MSGADRIAGNRLLERDNLLVVAGVLAAWINADPFTLGWVTSISRPGSDTLITGADAWSTMHLLTRFGTGVVNARDEDHLRFAGWTLDRAVRQASIEMVVAILLKQAFVRLQKPVQPRTQPPAWRMQFFPQPVTQPVRTTAKVPSAGAMGKSAVRPIETGLGKEVDELAGYSPTLQKDLKKLVDEKFEFRYGEAGEGSWMDTRSRIKTIVLDGRLKDNPASAVQTLAHEVGQATYPFTVDSASRATYIDSNLANEDAATLKNLEVQREIFADSRIDIGLAGNSSNHAAYNAAYDQYLRDGNATAARSTIGKIYGSREINSITRKPYADYYGKYYDDYHAK